MKTVTFRTGCKINLYLKVGPRRRDGYHDIDSLFLPLAEPHDEILATAPCGAASKKPVVSFFTDEPDGPKPAGIDPTDNTLTKACALFAEATGFAPPLHLAVIKGVPHGAGLGGGSANAAGLLLHLQNLAQDAGVMPLSPDALSALAVRVGADVPFFLQNRPAVALGAGEKLTPCSNPFSGMNLLLVCPKLRVSTAWAFAALDKSRAVKGRADAPDTLLPGNKHPERAMQKKIADQLTIEPPQASSFFAREQDFENDFEDPVFARFPKLHRLYGLLRESGADFARMSGTGAALFGLYRQRQNAEDAAKKLAGEDISVYIQRLPDFTS